MKLSILSSVALCVCGVTKCTAQISASTTTLPGTVYAGTYNVGGEGVGYHDVQKVAGGKHARLSDDVNVNPDGSISYIANGEWYAYSIDASAGTYNVYWLLSGDPAAGVNIDFYLTLDTLGCGGARLAPFTTANFDSGKWYPHTAYPAASTLTIPVGGRRRLTVCCAKASWVTWFGLRIEASKQAAASVVAPLASTVNASSLITAADSLFGTYVEGCTVDAAGRAYALNYIRDSEGAMVTNPNPGAARVTLGEIRPSTTAGADRGLVLKGVGGQWTGAPAWNGARIVPSSLVPSPPAGSTAPLGGRTALLVDEVYKRIMIGHMSAVGGIAQMVTYAFCGSSSMVQPNDLVMAANGRIFVSGMKWNYNTVQGDGDLWTCSPSTAMGGSVANKLQTMRRTNGIELSPNDRTLYLTEASTLNGTPNYNVIWAWDVDPAAGTVTNKRLFVDFSKLDGTGAQDTDGMRTDVAGNLYVTRNGGWQVAVFSPAGALLWRIKLTFRYPTNIEFGGADGRTLYIVGRCDNAPWGSGKGCVNTYVAPYAGRSWTMLQSIA